MSSARIYKRGSAAEAINYNLKEVLSNEAIREIRRRRALSGEGSRIDELEKEAYTKGFASGQRAGEEMGLKKYEGLLAKFDSMVKELSTYKENYFAENEKDLIELVTAVARKVVQAELEINPDVITNILSTALEAVISTEQVTVRLNPEDIKYLNERRAEVIENLTSAKGFTLLPSEELSQGDCMVESNHGEVYLSVEESLKKIRASMIGALGAESDTTEEDG